MNITEALRQARRSVPRSLAGVAEKMGATTQAASRIERDAGRANLLTLAKYVKALGGKLIVEIRMLGKDERTFRGDV
jgi:transcriptional regulator with XRE-family HTH domain